MLYPAYWKTIGDSNEHRDATMGLRVDSLGRFVCGPAVLIALARDLAKLSEGTAGGVKCSMRASSGRGAETGRGLGAETVSGLTGGVEREGQTQTPRMSPIKSKLERDAAHNLRLVERRRVLRTPATVLIHTRTLPDEAGW